MQKVSKSVLPFICCLLLQPVLSVQNQMCDMMKDLDKERVMCLARIENKTTGCSGTWDKITCWPSAEVGDVVTIPCPKYFFYYTRDATTRNLSKTCTGDGWTPVSMDSYIMDCGYNPNITTEENTGEFYDAIKVGYTIGHSVSLISLTIAIIILCLFRKLHCTRNYIHMNLFVAFILKAVAVFIKDVVLYDVGEMDNCQSPVGCKAVMVFFHYGIMASYFWLLVEGFYLHTLLAVSFFSERKYFWWYILIGWGVPSTVLVLWVLTRFFYDNNGCWDDTENVAIWWIIKGPITASLLVNIVIFINVIRILVQKLKSSTMAGNNDTGHFMRLAKSTLFLIPLFGMHYTVFAFLPENTGVAARLYIELGLGSFQGFVVALLYCFMNGEVQTELRRWLWKCHNQNHLAPAKQSITQITIRAHGGLRRPASSGNISTV